ncbi:unnamed protein product [Pelagomonas calceolata]|uniref:Uncharacterized protein n=1 Tax=Pelagomonas calceolata TaxID=35677 RepID=A0A8J2SX60_9STRA|nr:unnamed protein product [Pelagomonas calceolata]
MSVDALKAAYAAGDVTAVLEWLNFDQADPLAGIVRVLRAHCGRDSWHQLLREHLEDILAWSPDETEEFLRGIDFVANSGELTADLFVNVTNAVEARLGARRAKEACEFNTRHRAERNYCVKRMPERPALPRVFCWGPLEDVDAELAAIDQALWRGHNLIKQARRDAADAVDAGFVRFLVAACRTQLAVTSALWARAERDSYCDADGFARRLVLEPPSRDADGVPLLSRSEIDRVLPAIFGVDIVWAALPIDGPRRERQARAILVAEALYEARRKQLVAHAAAFGREVV